MSKAFLFLALVLCVSSTALATPVQETSTPPKQSNATADAELLEANKLTRDIVKLYGERKFVEAIEVAKRVIKIRQRKLGPNDHRRQ